MPDRHDTAIERSDAVTHRSVGGPRVLLIVESSGAGTGRHVLDLARGLIERNCDVHLIYSSLRVDKLFLNRLSEIDGLHCKIVDMRTAPHPSDLIALLSIRRYMKAHGPFNIIHGHSSKGGAIARLAALGTGVPAVYTPHGLVTMDHHLPRWKWLFYSSTELFLSLFTARIIAVSPEESRAAVRFGMGEGRVVMTPNGVGPASLTPREQARKTLGVNDSSIVIGFVGRLVEQKAPDVLIRAVALALKTAPNIRLAIVGGGPMDRPLRALATRLGIAGKIIWLGERDARQVLAAFDLFALASRKEGLPYVVLEAMAAGLPIVATTLAGVEILVDSGVNGAVVPPDDPPAFAAALISLVTNPQLLAECSKASLARSSMFTMDVMVDRTLDTYHSIAKDAAAPSSQTFVSVATPPVIILGGRANALSVARNIGELGVSVYLLNEEGTFAGYCRYAHQIPVPAPNKKETPKAWADFLLGPKADHLHGAIVLSCCDEGLELLIEHREALAERYILDEAYPTANKILLNKLSTYQAAVEAGVPTPKFWTIESSDQLAAVRDLLVFPLIVKPLLGHVFEGRTGKKLIVAQNVDEVAAAVDAVIATGTGCMLVEMIPGPDSRLCSYFTYLDADSKPLHHFTKRVIRRFPLLMGTGCYHITDWIPELPELANRLFSHVKLRGLANAEFKLDTRDGKYKLIECNARFNASDALIAASGLNLAEFVYRRLTRRRQPPMKPYRRGLRLWDPIRDFQAALEMRRRGELTLGQWIVSIMHYQTFFYFRWSDPLPALARLTLPLRKRLGLVRKRDV